VIRRGFWLVTGAVTGIYGYRRVAAVGRRVSASLTTGGTTSPPSRENRRPAITPGRVAIGAFRFARDVREGMDLYMSRHHRPEGPTLTTDHEAQPEDGR
jgi:hypothetical protein